MMNFNIPLFCCKLAGWEQRLNQTQVLSLWRDCKWHHAISPGAAQSFVWLVCDGNSNGYYSVITGGLVWTEYLYPPLNSYVEAVPLLTRMVLGGGTFGRELGSNEVIWVGPS